MIQLIPSVFLRLVVWRHAVRSSPGRSRFPRWILIKWLCRVSVGLKCTLRAPQMAPPPRQSSANLSMRQASRKGAGAFRSTETRRGRSAGVAGKATLWSPGRGFCLVHRKPVLGKSPKEARDKFRAAPEPGLYICRSGEKKVRSLHQLGKCYLLPCVDNMDHTFAGNTLPRNQSMTACVDSAHVMVCVTEDPSAVLLVFV